MKAKLKVLSLGLFALTLAACTNTTDTSSAPETEPVNAPATTGVVVGGGSDNSDVTSSDLASGEAMIGGNSVSNGGAVVSENDTVLYFDFDLSSLTPQARAALNRIAAALRESTGDIRVEGHADERGTREYNIALAERRANAVADFLTLQGVSASRIETISYGEERPAANGTGERTWSLNRRVEIK